MSKNQYKYKLITLILCISLITSLLITSCTKKTNDNTMYIQDMDNSTIDMAEDIQPKSAEAFDSFLDKMFIEYISASPLEMSLLISSCEPYGIEDSANKLDDYSDEALIMQYDNLRGNLKELNSFDVQNLTSDQQLTYEIIKYYLEINLEGEKYIDYAYNIKHTLGFHIGLPITLSQIPIECKSDAHNFISRLKQFPTSVSSLMESEKIKAGKGYIQPEYISDKVIEQCTSFMTNAEENMLYLSFCDYIDKLDDMSNQEKKSIKKECLDTINNYVYPCYTKFIDELKTIKSQTIITSGVYAFPQGTDYYSYLIKLNTGTDITPEDLFDLANSNLMRSSARMQSILRDNEELNLINDIQPNPFGSFEELFQKCEAIRDDNFYNYDIPKINSKTIPSYLEKDLPSAFYLPVSIDMKKYGNMFLQNSLYNSLNTSDFLIVCHEGIPGHHFQFSIAYQQPFPDIRKAISFSCYSEGWASYVEGIAIESLDFDNPLINELMICNLNASYSLLTLIDLYLHYYGASREEIINNYYMYFGDQIEAIVDRAIANPGETLHYAYGRYFMNNLKVKAQKALGDKFDIKEFHNTILINGEIPLFILEDIVDNYIQSKLNQ